MSESIDEQIVSVEGGKVGRACRKYRKRHFGGQPFFSEAGGTERGRKNRAILGGSARHKHAEKKLEQVGRQRTQHRQHAGRASKGVG